MFRWLFYLRWWKRQRDRQIFRFHDGTRVRKIDPMPAYLAIIENPDHRRVFADTMGTDPVQQGRAAIESATIVRRAFGIPEFEKGGLTVNECLGLALTFMQYVEDCKKKADTLPISAPSMEPTTSPDTTASPPESVLDLSSPPPESSTDAPQEPSPPSSAEP